MIASVFQFIGILLLVLLLFNLLIIVHELGHFLAARWRGMVVEQFAIWFGKPIWKKEINDVVYSLGSIPAGGFVKLPQMAPMEALEGDSKYAGKNLPKASALDKICVAFAGPLFSFLLAVFFALIVWVAGRPVGEAEATTIIGFVEEGGPAAQAGIQPGDQVLSVDGKPVRRFAGMTGSITWNVVRSEGETIPLTVLRDGEKLEFNVEPRKPEREGLRRASLRQLGWSPKMSAVVARVRDGTPAARAGLEPNDIIKAVDGEPVYEPFSLSEKIISNPDKTFNFTIQRGEETFEVALKPELEQPEGFDEPVPLIGLQWDMSGVMKEVHPDPVEQIYDSVMAIVKTLDALFSPKSDIKAEHMTGPVGIMRFYYVMFASEHGWRLALWFSVVINVNLAILNLLPLPVLDGGHILIASIEGVRRRPVNMKALEIIQTGCALLIIGYMLYVTFFDVQDLPVFNRGGPPPALTDQ